MKTFDIPIRYLFGLLLTASLHFSWVNFGIRGGDTQPWTFLACCLYLTTVKSLSIPPRLKVMIVSYFFILIIHIFSAVHGITSIHLRSVVNISTVVFGYIFLWDFIKRFGFPLNQFLFLNIVWLLCALVEIFHPTIFDALVHSRTTSSRGVTSLAAEPTFFAVYLIFANLILLGYLENKLPKFLFLLNFVFIIFIAKSAMGLLLILIWLTIYVLQNITKSFYYLKTNKLLLYAFLVLVVFITVITQLDFSDWRVAMLINRIIRIKFSILDFIIADASINTRVEGVYFPLLGFVTNIGFPNGVNTYLDFRSTVIGEYSNIFWYYPGGEKIMSWIGDIMYSYGVFGLILIYSLIKGLKFCHYTRFNSQLLILLFLLPAVPLAFGLPLLALILGRTSNATLK